MLATAIATVAGLLLSATVTARLHASHGFWSHRIGRSRLRRANLPVGGMAVLAAAVLIPAAAVPLTAAATAMAVVAVGVALVDPLPRLVHGSPSMSDEAKRTEALAHHWRGPWWWRLRCRASCCITRFAFMLEPEDLSSLSWMDGDRLWIADVRRPPGW